MNGEIISDTTEPAAKLSAALAGVMRAIAAVEAEINAPPGLTPQDLAEGYRSLISNLTATAQRVFTGFDLNNPRFVPLISDFWRGVWSNPDSHIVNAEIVAEGEYRIVGQLGCCADLNIEILTSIGGYDDVPFGQGQIDAIHIRTIATDVDGRFEIYVGGEPRPVNWLRAPPGPGSIFIRQTFSTWQAAPPQIMVERLNPAAVPASDPRHPTPDDMCLLLDQLAKRFPERYVATGKILEGFKQNFLVNDVALPATGKAGLLPSQYSAMSQFDIPAGMALVIVTAPVITSYQSIALGHHDWFEAFDPRYVQCSLTTMQSRISSDGLYRFVVCADDPGVPNWLDTAGHERGFLMMRWQGLAGPPPGKPEVKLLPVGEVRAQFPDDEPVIGASERLETQRQRRSAIYRRFP